MAVYKQTYRDYGGARTAAWSRFLILMRYSYARLFQSRFRDSHRRSPEVSSTAFRTQPPNLQPVPLMDMGFAVICPLARHRMPQIRFLYIGSYVCSTLPSDPPSPERPCASL